MTRTRLATAILVAALALAPAGQGGAQDYADSPSLAAEVAAGRLPAIAERLPRMPLVHAPGGDFEPGRHGGELRLIMGRSQDVRMMAVYGYARLVGYDTRFQRLWRFYLAYCVAGFRSGRTDLVQFSVARP
jgi:peptide/nickel transport system substrate-binding protein